MSLPDFTQNQLRAIAGLILLVIAIVYILSKSENENLEYIMIGLASCLVGLTIIGNKTIS